MTANVYSYFEYTDCKYECRKTNSNCLITESSLKYVFIDECETDFDVCKDRSSDYTVCLSLNNPPEGGQLIWPDFQRSRPSTTTEVPPAVDDHVKAWRITSITSIVFIALMLLKCLITKIYYYLIAERYEIITNISPDSPYQGTTEEI